MTYFEDQLPNLITVCIFFATSSITRIEKNLKLKKGELSNNSPFFNCLNYYLSWIASLAVDCGKCICNPRFNPRLC